MTRPKGRVGENPGNEVAAFTHLGGELKDEGFIFKFSTELAVLFRNDQKPIRVMVPLRGQGSSHNQIGLLWGASNGCHRPK